MPRVDGEWKARRRAFDRTSRHGSEAFRSLRETACVYMDGAAVVI